MVASSVISSSILPRSRGASHVRTYNWPPIQLNVWIFVMLLASCTILGVFATFLQIQQRMLLAIPWYFTYFMTVSSLTILFLLWLYWLIAHRRLLPAIVMIGAFMLFALWLTGLIVVGIDLFGPSGSVTGACNLAVFNKNPQGQTIEVLAYLQQKNICQSWQLVFAMALIGTTFLLWVMIMAYHVFVHS